MAWFTDAIKLLVDLGLLDVVLPFILVFTIVYGFLQKSKVLGTDNGVPKTKLNTTVALVFGLFTVAFANYVRVIHEIVLYSVIAIFGVIFSLIVSRVFGMKKLWEQKWSPIIAFVIVGLIGLLALLKENPFAIDWINSIMPPLIALLLFIFVIWYVLHDRKEKGEVKKPAKEEKKGELKDQIAKQMEMFSDKGIKNQLAGLAKKLRLPKSFIERVKTMTGEEARQELTSLLEAIEETKKKRGMPEEDDDEDLI